MNTEAMQEAALNEIDYNADEFFCENFPRDIEICIECQSTDCPYWGDVEREEK